jgi:hypothetical protein
MRCLCAAVQDFCDVAGVSLEQYAVYKRQWQQENNKRLNLDQHQEN